MNRRWYISAGWYAGLYQRAPGGWAHGEAAPPLPRSPQPAQATQRARTKEMYNLSSNTLHTKFLLCFPFVVYRFFAFAFSLDIFLGHDMCLRLLLLLQYTLMNQQIIRRSSDLLLNCRLFNIPLPEELRMVLRRGILPIYYVLQATKAELRAEDTCSTHNWSIDKDRTLFRQSLSHFFSWKSLLSDKV